MSISFSNPSGSSGSPNLDQLEFVSTAYYLSILPPVLDQLLPVFASLKGASSADVSELALNVLFEIVSNRIAMHAFKFWAPGVPPPSQGTKATPAGVYKYRLYAYWLDGKFLKTIHGVDDDNSRLCVSCFSRRSPPSLLQSCSRNDSLLDLSPHPPIHSAPRH
jgi:hypothetical protein